MGTFLFKDSFFRRVTFGAGYTSDDKYAMAEQGLISIYLTRGNYDIFSMQCVFCEFADNDDFHKIDFKLDVTMLLYTHGKKYPTCPGIFPAAGRVVGNIPYRDIYQRLGLTGVGPGTFEKRSDGEKIWTGKKLKLNAYVNTDNKKNDRSTCSVCLQNVPNVVTRCNHIVICSVCISSPLMKPICVYCRNEYQFYTHATLPSIEPL